MCARVGFGFGFNQLELVVAQASDNSPVHPSEVSKRSFNERLIAVGTAVMIASGTAN